MNRKHSNDAPKEADPAIKSRILMRDRMDGLQVSGTVLKALGPDKAVILGLIYDSDLRFKEGRISQKAIAEKSCISLFQVRKHMKGLLAMGLLEKEKMGMSPEYDWSIPRDRYEEFILECTGY